MRQVAVLGVGMHPWGKFPGRSVTELCRHAIDAALADAGVRWREIQAVAAASSRFSGGKGWGLNGNDVVEVYVDYQCPFCQRWEESIGTPLAAKALQPGSDLLVKQYNLAFLGEASPTLTPAGASARAASAAACVINHDGVETFDLLRI